jgi:hypothetical protein
MKLLLMQSSSSFLISLVYFEGELGMLNTVSEVYKTLIFVVNCEFSNTVEYILLKN